MYLRVSKEYISARIRSPRFLRRKCSAISVLPYIHSIESEGFFKKPLSERLVSAGNTLSTKIMDLRFYSEMFNESLCSSRYNQFIIQDIFYLQERLKVLEIAQRRFSNHALLFSGLTLGDQEELQKFDVFRLHLKIDPLGNMNSACRNYVIFLNDIIENKSLEEFIAALLPCLWVFQKIAMTYIDRVGEVDNHHLYFHFLKDMREYLVIGSMNKLFLVLDLEVSSKSLNEQDHCIPLIVGVFMCGLLHEIEFYNSFYL